MVCKRRRLVCLRRIITSRKNCKIERFRKKNNNLVVNDKIRSKGYGTLMLKHLKEMSGNKEITLNIEPLYENADNFNVEDYKKAISKIGMNM